MRDVAMCTACRMSSHVLLLLCRCLLLLCRATVVCGGYLFAGALLFRTGSRLVVGGAFLRGPADSVWGPFIGGGPALFAGVPIFPGGPHCVRGPALLSGRGGAGVGVHVVCTP